MDMKMTVTGAALAAILAGGLSATAFAQNDDPLAVTANASAGAAADAITGLAAQTNALATIGEVDDSAIDVVSLGQLAIAPERRAALIGDAENDANGEAALQSALMRVQVDGNIPESSATQESMADYLRSRQIDPASVIGVMVNADNDVTLFTR